MNTLIKLTLTALAIATLAGCASVPQAPKDAQEMVALGDDNLLSVPVDITGFLDTAKKVKIVSEIDEHGGLFGGSYGVAGDIGQTTIFTNPADGKTYDMDGQPVNAKGLRVLKNGYVCKVIAIGNNTRLYANPVLGDSRIINGCMSSKLAKQRQTNEKMIIGGALLGGIPFLGSVIATQIDMRTQDDTL